MAKSAESITLGIGDLSVDGEDVGYLAGGVTVTTETESKEFRYGTHQSLVKTVVTTLGREIKASLAQIDINTLRLALGIGEAVEAEGISRLNFGNNWTMATLNNVKFVHTRDDGKKVVVFFPKAQVAPESTDLEFTADDFLEQPITIKAVEDLTRPDCPFGFIQVGESEETGEISAIAVTDEAVSGVADGTGYKYEFAHSHILSIPAPVIKSSDGNTTYTAGTDYILDRENGSITTKGCASTTLTEGASIKASYSYSGIANGAVANP